MANANELEGTADLRADRRTTRLVELAWTLWHEPAGAPAEVDRDSHDDAGAERVRVVVTAIRAARR